MAYLYRLIVVALLVFSASSASAATYQKWYPYSNPLASQPRFATPLEACQYYVNAIWGIPGTATATMEDGATYGCRDPGGGYRGQASGTAVSLTCNAPLSAQFTGTGSSATWTCEPPTCGANSTWNGSSCACNTGFVPGAGGTCEPFNPCANHQQLWSSYNGSVQMVKGATSVCSGGCQVGFKPGYEGADLYGAGDDGVLRGWVPVGQLQSSNTEGTCATPTEPAAVPVPDVERPPLGTCPGQINGVTVNVPCSSTESSVKKTEALNDGAGNTTTKAESRSTTCTAAGSCATTVTTITSVNGGAPVTSTKTIEESKGEFCVGNPAAKECGDGEGSSFGGSCDAGFLCEGDAVQCAHAKETHVQNCRLNKDTPERQLYESSKGDDADFDNDDVVNVGPSSFSQAPILGAASCISDKSITVMGSPVSLPFSRVCEYLSMLGNVLMAVGFLLSGRIIMRG